MNNDFNVEEISNLIHKALDELGLRLYDIHFNKVSRTLRVFIDKEKKGITVEDCRKVSTMISKMIDDSDVVTFPYTLEVSSPGIERSLKRPEHYRWAMGKLVEIDIGDKKIKGYIRSIKDNGVVVATDLGEDLVPYSTVIKAKVVEDIEYGKRR